jgi:hypothetical protein
MILISMNISAQNLVPNPSFEDTISCPNSVDQINRATSWMSFSVTPDYFNSCAPGNVPVPVSVPHNIWGDQSAFSGNGYAGIEAYKAGSTNAREYIGAQLIEPLVIGQRYYLAFFVSNAFGYMQNQYPGAACNNLGVKFTTSIHSQVDPLYPDNFAQVFDTSIIADTVNWVKISGSFVADSLYNFICIGNFFDDSNTFTASIGNLFNEAYYYVDNIILTTDSSLIGILPVEKYGSAISVFPNPASNDLTIAGNNITFLEMLDIIGRKIEVPIFKLNDSHYEVNLSFLSEEIYILKIHLLNDQYLLQKIIKQN